MGKLKYMGKTKPAKVKEVRLPATEAWKQQQYAALYQETAYYSSSPQSETPEAAFHHMHTVQVNNFNKQEDNQHMWPLWLTTQLDVQVHQFHYMDMVTPH